jgi:Ser/Thr protein kinase RdoA (MazF antagonist)
VRDPERVLFQLQFQEHLRARGYPTSEVVRTAGRELFIPLAGVPWALFRFVEGEEYGYTSLTQATDAGRRLAEFHVIAGAYDGPVPPVTPGEVDFAALVSPAPGEAAANYVLSDAHEARLQRLFPAPGYADELAHFADWRRRAARAWPGERIAALPVALLHTDYHGRNMVFQGDRIAGVFDFDFVTRGPRTFDLGRGIFNFGRERRGSLTIREDFAHAFLEGYDRGEPLTLEERRSLGFMAVLNWCPDAPFYESRLPEEGAQRIAERLRSDMTKLRGVEAEMKRLAPEFGWEAV